MHKSGFVMVLAGAALLLASLLWGGPVRGAAERWSTDERELIASLALDALPPPPADPSNAVEGRPQAAVLGKRLFGDVRLSRNQAVSCASCHAPDRQFQDGLPLARGVGLGTRRAMPIAGAAHDPWLFWDGRKDSLWSQALGPLEDGVEHGGNRTRLARHVRSHYRAEYEALFGAMPDFADLPADAGPLGNATERAAWQAMTPANRADVSRVFANIGKAIAAYEKTLAYGAARFDAYAKALRERDTQAPAALTPQEVKGLRLFIGKGQCVSCHNGPLLSDHAFHNTGVPPRDAARPDRGRAAAIAKVQGDEFNCLGPFSDAAGHCEELRFITASDATLEAAFKTPGLRNVALRPPYMHAGQYATLEQAIAHYVEAPAAAIGHSELASAGSRHSERKPIRLSAEEVRDVAAFLTSLSGPIVERALP
jgi:cytochrome c peroxidase